MSAKAFTVFDTIEDLDSESKYLVHKAKEATKDSYAPYSKFHVGAALILEDGTVVLGANQENAAYPLCMCAERVALYVAASQYPEKKIKKLAVVAHKKNHKELVSILLDKGADSNITNSFGLTPLTLATMHGHKEIAQILEAKKEAKCLIC